MLAAVDVHYGRTDGRAAAVVFSAWADATPILERTLCVGTPAPYRSGAFYERELPAVRAILGALGVPLRCVVVDAYAWLAHGRPGLGAHLWEALGRAAAVVGVAKNPLREHAHALPVLRGASRRPLWVTAAGMDPAAAAVAIASMHGRHRIPTLLARADRLARGG